METFLLPFSIWESGLGLVAKKLTGGGDPGPHDGGWLSTLSPLLALPRQLCEILAMTQYGHCREREVGVDWLLSKNVFTAAFPLHEVRLRRPPGIHPATLHPWPAPLPPSASPHRVPTRSGQMSRLPAASASAKSSSSTGPAGGSGASTNRWITSASTLGRRLLSTSPGWVSPACSRAALGSPGNSSLGLLVWGKGLPAVGGSSWLPRDADAALPRDAHHFKGGEWWHHKPCPMCPKRTC